MDAITKLGLQKSNIYTKAEKPYLGTFKTSALVNTFKLFRCFISLL